MAIVQRTPADKPGDDIISPILTTATAQVERGRQEINYHMYDRQLETQQLLDVTFVKPGEIAQLQTRGQSKNGKVTGFSMNISMENGLSISTNIEMDFVK